MSTESENEELRERVRELEEIVNRELGYNLGGLNYEPQTVNCTCGKTFEVNLENGLICPDCGAGQDDWGEGHA